MTKKQVVPVVITLVLALLCGIIYMVNSSSWESKLSAQNKQIQQLQNQITVKEAANQNTTNTVVQQTTGLNQARVDSDKLIAEEFLEKIMTWDSYEEYQSLREWCMNTYGVEEDSKFLQIFMPEVVIATANDGSTYNRIDTSGLNVQYEGMDTYVTRITANNYSYFSFVTWSSHDSFGNEAATTAIFTYDINGNGELSNIDAYTIADVRTE